MANDDVTRLESVKFQTLGAAAERPEWSYDELRIGQGYFDVVPVPEPGILGLVLLGTAVFALRRLTTRKSN